MPTRRSHFALLLALVISAISGSNISSLSAQENEQNFKSPPNTQKLEIPMTPAAEALKMIDLPTGFKATLFASEPDVHQPISVTTDARGRLWVAECYTYSDGKENYNTDLFDRIVIFEDTDNDGVFDNRKIFADKLKKLTSVEVGFGGVWVTAAPNFMFIPDANGDDIPDDKPIILLDGFEGNVIRHNIVNGLRWGHDGWLYGRHGIQATSFVGVPDATESQRIPMNCAIWRYHPLYHEFEIVAQGGTNPWGFDFDEHGEMFMINTVIGHLFHVVPNARYRRMYGAHFNPHIYQVIEQTADHFHWDVSEEHWAVTKKEGMSDGTDLAGGGHAHTGLMIYQGGNWPKSFHNQLFTANFHGRRINSDSIHRQGNSYVAKHGPDYFRTKDPWFRGIEMIYGPDGGVFLLDWSDIGECHENDGIHRTSGRIFKLTYGETKLPDLPNLKKLNLDELIDLLGHKNEWYVRKARRILQERLAPLDEDDPAKMAGLQKLSAEYESADSVKTKLRIMWARYSCDSQPDAWLQKSLADEDEHVRSWAVRLLADGIITPSESTTEKFLQLAETDDSGLVRLYLASALQRLESQSALTLALNLASHESDAGDRAQPSMIWFGTEPHVVDNTELAIELATSSKLPLLRRNIIRRLTTEIESKPQVTKQIVSALFDSQPQVQIEILEGMTKALDGWSKATAPDNWEAVRTKLAASKNETIDGLVQKLDLVFGDGRATDELKSIAASNKYDVATRRRAIAALAGTSEAPKLYDFFKPLISDRALATEITKALVRCEQPETSKLILNNYKRMDPEGKSEAINVLVARKPWAKALLKAVEKNKVEKSVVSASHARQIRNFEDDDLNQLLSQSWGEIRETSEERVKQIEKFRGMLTAENLKNANREVGQTVYEMNCANCHTLFGKGGKIGPDLTGSDRKNLNYILENVVDPSASVAESYQTSVIVLEDGRLLTGVVVLELARTIQLQTKDELLTIDRTQIDEQRQTKNSLMPDGLFDNLSEEQIKGLVRFLMN